MSGLFLALLLFGEPKQFPPEAFAAWAAYRQDVKALQGTSSWTFAGSLHNVKASGDSEMKIGPNGCRMVRFRNKGRDEVFCRNSSYAFALPGPRTAAVDAFDQQFDRFYEELLDCLKVAGQPIQGFLADGSFKVEDVQRPQVGGGAQVWFHCDEMDGALSFTALWTLSRYELHLSLPTADGSAVFKVLESGFVPKRATLQKAWKLKDGRTNRQLWTYSNDLVAGVEWPEELFTLSAFGLPEPESPSRRVVPWAVIVGATCVLTWVILGLFFRIKKPVAQ